MDERPAPPPESKLIKAAQKAAGLSTRKAAALAGMSESRWRQIVAGSQRVNKQDIPFTAPAETIARMARTVGLTADRLAKARPEAADELRRLRPDTDTTSTALAELKDVLVALADEQAILARRTREALVLVEQAAKHEADDG